jgi:hypothetical protein
MAKRSIPRSRRRAFTIPNPDNQIDQKIDDWIRKPKVKTLIIGLEHGSNGHFNHSQGYGEVLNPKRIRGMKKIFENKAHWEIAKAGKKDNVKYCSKEGQIKGTKNIAEQTVKTEASEQKNTPNKYSKMPSG